MNFGFVHLLEKPGPEKYDMLSLQIKRLMTCLDVLLESWQMQNPESKSDFAREKMFLHCVRGRRRLPPLKYDPSLQMFSQ